MLAGMGFSRFLWAKLACMGKCDITVSRLGYIRLFYSRLHGLGDNEIIVARLGLPTLLWAILSYASWCGANATLLFPG